MSQPWCLISVMTDSVQFLHAAFAPSCAKRRAVARPTPPDAPVMTTTSPMSFDFPRLRICQTPYALSRQHLHGVAVAQLMLAADLLALESRRRPPDACARALRA